MAHSPTYEVRVRREIRKALAIDPIATIPELTERLNKRLSHSFDPRYIKKLTDKVAHQLIIESDRLRIEDRMKVTRRTAASCVRNFSQFCIPVRPQKTGLR